MTADLEIAAQLDARLGSLAAGIKAEQDWRRKCAGAIQQVPIVSTQLAGSGTIDQPDAMMAKTGYIWGIRRLTVTGFSAGTVTIYKNAAGGEPVAPFPAAAVFTYGKGQLLLMPGERLVIVGSGITGTVQLWGTADCFESWYLPYYLG